MPSLMWSPHIPPTNVSGDGVSSHSFVVRVPIAVGSLPVVVVDVPRPRRLQRRLPHLHRLLLQPYPCPHCLCRDEMCPFSPWLAPRHPMKISSVSWLSFAPN